MFFSIFFQKQTKKENRITSNKSVITNYFKNENFTQIQLLFIFFNLFQEIKKTSNSSIKYQQTDKADKDAKKIKKKQIVVFKNHKLIPLIKFDEKFLNYINLLAQVSGIHYGKYSTLCFVLSKFLLVNTCNVLKHDFTCSSKYRLLYLPFDTTTSLQFGSKNRLISTKTRSENKSILTTHVLFLI